MIKRENEKNKQIISSLITDVLTNKKTVQEALIMFPKDTEDINIKCAFDALMHREADEDLRIKISDYAQTQDDYLLAISEVFQKGDDLPENIVQKYFDYHEENLIGDNSHGLKSVFKSFLL